MCFRIAISDEWSDVEQGRVTEEGYSDTINEPTPLSHSIATASGGHKSYVDVEYTSRPTVSLHCTAIFKMPDYATVHILINKRQTY